MLEIFDNTKIYIVAPANSRTAGPELLHQMAFYIRNFLKFNVYMYFVPPDHPNPIPSDFKEYGNCSVNKIEDECENIIIVPEIYNTLKIFDNFCKIRKVIWWMSIDNFFIDRFIFKDIILSLPIRIIKKLTELLSLPPILEINKVALKYYSKYKIESDPLVKQAILNICSAHHVKLFLEKRGLKVFFLVEFLNNDFLDFNTDLTKKENIIVYNPLKGAKFTRKIINNAKHLNFVPISNLSRKDVIKLLQRAKVYIDFGNHPGRDRLPREAALLKCCIITNRKGGAMLKEDLGIPEEYKFDDNFVNIPLIINKIEDCLTDYENKLYDFEKYRKSILEEPSLFLEGIKKLFVKV
ncbi:hypothetical protein ABRY23_13695 [Melioribacteraceae bacterium 4301-Me]|uniref:hypothetical protein n=1 Tax=Pyranulibacter aquaticus TaxID=3163344 RepID=UPI0035974FE5